MLVLESPDPGWTLDSVLSRVVAARCDWVIVGAGAALHPWGEGINMINTIREVSLEEVGGH